MSHHDSFAHSVRLFDTLDNRGAAVAEFIHEGVANGETVLAVQTKQTWGRVADGLTQRGVDPEKLIQDGRVIALDAHKELDRFMRRDWPDAGLFESTVGAIVLALANKDTPLRVYGELVDILAERGHHRAAHRLEQIWN